MEFGDVGVGNKDIGGRWECGDDGLGNVRDQMETAVDGILAEDGYFMDIRLCHFLEERLGRECNL